MNMLIPVIWIVCGGALIEQGYPGVGAALLAYVVCLVCRKK